MPNHVEQDLVVTGDVTALREFMEFAKDDSGILSANKFIPYPEKYRILDQAAKDWELANPGKWQGRPKDGFNSGGYEWCIQNWGTKWGIYGVTCEVKKLGPKVGKVFYNFQSAWSPALLIVEAMSNKFHDLKFDLKYYECGMCFKGNFIVKAGVTLKNVESKYHGSRGG